MDLRSDRYWWDDLSDAELTEALQRAGVQAVVVRNLVPRREDPAARYRIRLELPVELS